MKKSAKRRVRSGLSAKRVWTWHPAHAMADLELKRRAGDRRLYALEGVGTLRLKGLASRAATAEAGGSSWQIGRRRFWQRRIKATDAADAAGEREQLVEPGEPEQASDDDIPF